LLEKFSYIIIEKITISYSPRATMIWRRRYEILQNERAYGISYYTDLRIHPQKIEDEKREILFLS
jgi:hypothetical protein